jgi:hypothetical protein
MVRTGAPSDAIELLELDVQVELSGGQTQIRSVIPSANPGVRNAGSENRRGGNGLAVDGTPALDIASSLGSEPIDL